MVQQKVIYKLILSTGLLLLAGIALAQNKPNASSQKGIAARYPGDEGVEKHKSVVFTSGGFLLQTINTSAKDLPHGIIPVSAPGSYDKPGTVYKLTNDIVSERSAIFLGKDVTLDLNGHTITFAGANYEHVPNSGFENGLEGWDVSEAPGAKVVNTAEVHAFIGEKILSFQPGDEIRSPYINLPVENRSYFAMCGLTGRYYHDMGGDLKNDMKVSIFVDDENGNEVECVNQYGDTTRIGCPVIKRSARLGGGFVFAHLKDLPEGKYRIRVKAETDCLVDQVDIRPAMDVGIGIVENTHPYGHYNHFYDIVHSAFYDYTENFKDGKPVAGIPTVEGKGTITIKNGTIKSGTRGIASWGIQSTADDVRVILDSVTIINQGINATAVDVPYATITNCIFKVDNPFIINRQGSQFYAVDLRGTQHSEVSYSEFYGGQGNLVIKGLESKIHHNYLVNRQTVTNHSSIMAMGDGSMIFENKFEPEIGSGLEIFRHKNIKIFYNNFIKAAVAPDFSPVRMGSFEQEICVAENVAFRSNEFQGLEFAIDATPQHHSYTVLWTLNVNTDKAGSVIKITNKKGREVVTRNTDKIGELTVELPEYSVDGDEKVFYSPYFVMAGGEKIKVELKKIILLIFKKVNK